MMNDNPIFYRAEQRVTLSLDNYDLVGNNDIAHNDDEAKKNQTQILRRLIFFVVANLLVLSVALFRMFYVSRFDAVQVNAYFLYDMSVNHHYLDFAIFIGVVFAVAWAGMTLIMAVDNVDGRTTNMLRRQFISCVFTTTLTWLLVFGLYHHKAFLIRHQIESIESGLWMLIPLAYMAGIWVIPRFTLFMLFSLIVQQSGDGNLHVDHAVMALMLFFYLILLLPGAWVGWIMQRSTVVYRDKISCSAANRK